MFIAVFLSLLHVAYQYKEFFMFGYIKRIEQFFDGVILAGKLPNDIRADTYLKGDGDNLALKAFSHSRHMENRVSGKCNFLPLCYVGCYLLVAVNLFHACIS